MRVVENIRYIATKKNIKLKDLESAMGTSAGFLSRVSLRASSLTIDKISKAADYMNTSIVALVLPESDNDPILQIEDLFIEIMNKSIRNKIKWKDNKARYRKIRFEYKDESLYVNKVKLMERPWFNTELNLLEEFLSTKEKEKAG